MEWQGSCPSDHALLEVLNSGLQSDVDLQDLIQDIEEKLRANACSIEQNLHDLQGKIGGALGREKVPSPTECLRWFSPGNLNSLNPILTNQQELRDFLRALQHLLKTEDSREEAVLRLLLSISSQCGVAFPSSTPLSGQAPSPAPPVCSVRDDLALEVQDIWDDIRFMLQRHLLDSLQTVASASAERPVFCGASEKILLLQQLFFLYPKKEVLAKYQVLQSKMVLGLLRSGHACTSGSGRDLDGRGFDGLAQSFQAANHTFRSMLEEEIRVLSGIAEPHAVVDFLNRAYLGPVGQELAILMEREVEVSPKNNAAHSEKVVRSSSKKSTVAPQDAPGKGRGSLLTSQQLRGVAQLAATLLEMERSVEDLATVLGFPICTGGADSSLPETAVLVDGKISPERLLAKTETVCLEFHWRAAFHQLAPQMVDSVRQVLDQVCSDALQQEETTHASDSCTAPLVPAPLAQDPPLPFPDRDMPKMVVKFCADVMEEMEVLLPLALTCMDHALLPVRSSYVEACGHVASALLARLEERAQEVPASAPLRKLAALLASSAYIHQRLAYFERQLKGPARTSLTLLPVGRSQEVWAAMREHLTSCCVHVCGTSVLQDAESHHWADPRPFYEGERCSFSIQMWHYFLCGLRSDLWESLAPAMAQDILAQVLAQTLELLVQRYSRAQPSCRRLPQIRADITAILLCAHQLMWSVCGSVEELLRPELASETWVAFIHSLCEQLLDVLVILTVPLPELYRTFQNGFGESSSSTSAEVNTNSVPFWLSAINPLLFPQELQSRDHTAGHRRHALRLMGLVSSGPGWRPTLLLQAVLHADALLLRTLVSHCHLCLDSEASPEAPRAAAEFVEAVFAVLSSLNSFPRALALVLEDYLARSHLWEHFHTLSESVEEDPPLFACIRAVVSKATHGLLNDLVNLTLERPDLSVPLLRQDLPQDVLAKIPSKWQSTLPETKTKEANKDTITLTIQALSFIFTHLPSAVATIPLPVRYLFHVAEKRLPQHGGKLKAMGLLPWVLIACLARDLKDESRLNLTSTRPVEQRTKELLALASDCLQGSVGQQKGVVKPIVRKVLQSLEDERPTWTSTQLQKARMLCEGSSVSTFERVEGGLLEERGGPSEPTEQKMGLALLALCQGTGGSQNLRRIHCTIQLNEELLRSILTSAEDRTSSPQGLPPFLFPSSSSGHASPTCPFNPFSHFQHVGQTPFDQSAMSEREWDWDRLLTSYQRMSQVTFRVLLANRWEMQDGAALEGEEKILVENLREMYLNRNPES